jgi:3-hydroxyisobutyrate dehydrogenase-like beta-hydroxyacid dehydrogenase
VIIGILHPGAMGSAVGRCLSDAGHRVLWAGESRSADSRARATSDGLIDVGTVHELLAESAVVISVVPPHAAISLARQVAGIGYAGSFVDANAISPHTCEQVAEIVRTGGARFVDGAIIGSPPRDLSDPTRLYLSGPDASELADLCPGSILEIAIVAGPVGQASALKLCYAAWTKGTNGLLMAVRAAAAAAGVEQALTEEWARSLPGLEQRSIGTARSTADKAWRFVAEMNEIADLFDELGLPAEIYRGLGEVFARVPRADLSELDDAQAVRTVVEDIRRAKP